jgi:hypothetical protein
MPARQKNLPSYVERTALQRLHPGEELSARDLEPTTARTILKLLAKGWIELGSSSGRYRITPAGDAALSAPLPLYFGEAAAVPTRQLGEISRVARTSTTQACRVCGIDRHLISRERLPRMYEIRSLECPTCHTVVRLVCRSKKRRQLV